jgi:hypothetical protein
MITNLKYKNDRSGNFLTETLVIGKRIMKLKGAD